MASSNQHRRKPPRGLDEIARDILTHWSSPYYAAVPYIEAMRSMYSVSDRYGAESGEEIIIKLLPYIHDEWKGEQARRIERELRAMINPQIPSHR